MTKYSKNATIPKAKGESGLSAYVRNYKLNDMGWEIIAQIKQQTDLKVFAKGIMCYDDALLAINHGADGIMVSNHGAR